MGLLVLANLLQVGIERVLESSLDEVGLGVVLEALFIESSLKVLQGQCIVQDVS